ncbi:MAG: ferredoxin:glutaredoxin reductase [Candidatus Bathyarchaeota archaeon]|nr:ferredoxin:glutaredoxin reductase [Candidatus Bathyarchaeota archaeon]
MTPITIEQTRKRAEADAKTFGYFLVNDPELLQGLMEGLKTNEERYGYPSCPCRLASGNLDYDRDIICPCDYRDPDVAEYGACYCRLYVNKDVYEGKTELPSVPERRPMERQVRAFQAASIPKEATEKPQTTPKAEAKEEAEELVEIMPKLWYCKQCGYVVYREDPPYVCPICKAKREMFAEITTKVVFSG